MAAARAKRRPAPKKKTAPAKPSLPRLELQPHQLDLLALALAAAGVFLAAVLWADVAGGRLGDALTDGLRWLVGLLAYAAPAALVVAGGLVVGRDLVPAMRPVRTGAICLLLGLALALAAGTFGLGPGDPRPPVLEPAGFTDRGGALGDGMLWVLTQLVSEIGADIAAVFLLLAAALLLSGATVAGIVRTAHTSVTDTSRALREKTRAQTALGLDGRPPAPPLLPPEPAGAELLVSAPAWDDEDENEDEEPWEPEPEAVEAEDATLVVPAPEEADDEPAPAEETAVAYAEDQLTPQGRLRAEVTEDPAFEWRIPPAPKVLTRSRAEDAKPDTAGQAETASRLTEALGHFGVQAKVVGTVAGPHITRYELRLAPGIKVGKVANLKDDLAYALAAADIRIQAPIPGKQAVGVEVPNQRRKIVHLGDVFGDPPADWSPLAVWLGKDVSGRGIGADLAKMPHLLVAGTTGAGKSGCVNAMLSSVLLRATPHEVRMVLVDPKQVELNHYESIPHLLTPVITSPRKAANALQNLVKEMEERYTLMSLARTRSLPELNASRARRDEKALPYILCVIDELADLMMVAPADVEDSIIRLAQKARAVGIHLVLATQSPRVDVITGMIKANVPSRIAFAVSSQTDSRVILDQNGAETLLGQGDMLFAPVGSSKLQRIQGAYVDEAQIAQITGFWRRQGEPDFREELLEEVPDDHEDDAGGADEDGYDPNEDPLLDEAIALVAQMGTASTSMLQRRLRLGYTRAGRLIDMLERRGVISGYEGSKPRQVLISEHDVPRIVAALAESGGRSEPGPDPGLE
jgi:S-DNA-T family DNA segregation ATPase FtsK/SpoIIIE